MKRLATSYLVVLGLLTASGAQAQRCVSGARPADQQVVLPNGDVVLLATRFYGDLMSVVEPDKQLRVNCVRLNPQGRLLRDTTITLPWPEWHYDFLDCKASYRDNSQKNYPADSVTERQCALYMPFFGPQNQLTVGYYLLNDPAHAYELRIDQRGWVKGAPLKMPGASFHQTGFAKFQQVSLLVNHPPAALVPAPAPGFVVETAGCIRLVDFPQVKLVPDPQDTLTAQRGARRQWPHWGVQGPDWWLPLPGYLSTQNVLVTVSGPRLYLTVMHAEPRRCPPLPDTWPIMCCVDLTSGKLLWQHAALLR